MAKPPATALDANPANAAATANETSFFGFFMITPPLLKAGRSTRSARQTLADGGKATRSAVEAAGSPDATGEVTRGAAATDVDSAVNGNIALGEQCDGRVEWITAKPQGCALSHGYRGAVKGAVGGQIEGRVGGDVQGPIGASAARGEALGAGVWQSHGTEQGRDGRGEDWFHRFTLVFAVMESVGVHKVFG